MALGAWTFHSRNGIKAEQYENCDKWKLPMTYNRTFFWKTLLIDIA
jgi:hypothetical protein